MKALTPSHTKVFITNCLMIRKIPYISGPPGIGKSDLVYEVGKEFNLLVLDVRLSQMLPEDLTGLPSLNSKSGKAEYNPFSTFPMDNDPIPDGYDGWLIFLDELSSASEEVMAAIYSLLLGHRVGGKLIHSKAVIVAAGNRSTDSAIARELPDTLITRMMPCEMKAAAKDWLIWAEGKGIHDSIISFITKYPDMLISTVDPSKREELEPYPTPRGWETISRIVRLHEKNSNKNRVIKKDAAGIPLKVSQGAVISPDIQAMMFSAIGIMAATAYKEHYDESMQLPYPWEVAQSPSSTKIPATNSGKAELTANLADHFIESADQSRDAILQFMNRMDKEHASLFTRMITEKLGSTASDIRMIEDVKKRLNVEDIFMDDVAGTKGSVDPLFQQGNILSSP